MDIKTYLEQTGVSQAEFARRLEVTPSMVSQWMSQYRPIAAEKVIPIERATGGSCARWELRPDIYPPEEYRQA